MNKGLPGVFGLAVEIFCRHGFLVGGLTGGLLHDAQQDEWLELWKYALAAAGLFLTGYWMYTMRVTRDFYSGRRGRLLPVLKMLLFDWLIKPELLRAYLFDYDYRP